MPEIIAIAVVMPPVGGDDLQLFKITRSYMRGIVVLFQERLVPIPQPDDLARPIVLCLIEVVEDLAERRPLFSRRGGRAKRFECGSFPIKMPWKNSL